jgi:phthalate 4,5-cis-dihydrodiol dehydrogenase
MNLESPDDPHDFTEPVRLGIVGLGMAGAVMVHAAAFHRGIRIVAAADPQPDPRAAFTRDFGTAAFEDARQVCERSDVEAVYIATPHQFHREHAILAAECGKHVIVEKPMALSLEDCDAIIEAVDRNKVHLIVGHTHGFDPAVREMRRIISSGTVGTLGLVAMWNYTNFIHRPRRPEELDTARGGGILFNQIPHQIDTLRVLGGDISSVRAIARQLDPSRPTEGLASALLQFQSGAAATITYSGYDYFDADEFHFWIAESGAPKPADRHGTARRALLDRREDETVLRVRNFALGARPQEPPPHQPHFGVMIVTCSNADLRASRDGVLIYGRDGVREIVLPERPGIPGRREVLDDLYGAVRHGRAPLQDAPFGRATLATVLAILRSSKERREVMICPPSLSSAAQHDIERGPQQ